MSGGRLVHLSLHLSPKDSQRQQLGRVTAAGIFPSSGTWKAQELGVDAGVDALDLAGHRRGTLEVQELWRNGLKVTIQAPFCRAIDCPTCILHTS